MDGRVKYNRNEKNIGAAENFNLLHRLYRVWGKFLALSANSVQEKEVIQNKAKEIAEFMLRGEAAVLRHFLIKTNGSSKAVRATLFQRWNSPG
jgi:hypothetical protein